MAILYDPSEGYFGTLFRWRGTLLQLVFTQPIFWILQLFHILFRLLLHYTNLELPDAGSWPEVSSLMALVAFFTVFYGQACFNRYQMFYGHCVGIAGGLMAWAGLVKINIPKSPAQWNAVRYALASAHVMYYTLTVSNDVDSKGISDTEWATVKERQLLSDVEIEKVQAYKGGNRQWLLLTWAMRVVITSLHDHPDRSILLHDFRQLALGIRGDCGQISNWFAMPVAFPYFHALTLFNILTLVLIAYTLANDDNIVFAIVVFFSISTAFLGLRQVAVTMADPFGTDEVDFDVTGMLSSMNRNVLAILADEYDPLVDSLPVGVHQPSADVSPVRLKKKEDVLSEAAPLLAGNPA